MSLSRLATVELQLIMHGLDIHSLIALARCSRFTLTSASDSFAWRHVGAVQISPTQVCAGVPPTSLVARFGGFHLRWTHGDEFTPAEMGLALSFPRLRGLELAAPLPSAATVTQLLLELHRLGVGRMLRDLDLIRSQHDTGVPQVQALIPLLRASSGLESLRLSMQDIQVTSALWRQLISAISTCSSLRRFALHGEIHDVALLVEALAQHGYLRDLALYGCNLGAAVVPLAQALPSSMRSLFLDRCGMEDDGAVAIAALLGRCAGMRDIGLTDNLFRDRGVLALLRAIRPHRALRLAHLGTLGMQLMPATEEAISDLWRERVDIRNGQRGAGDWLP